MTDNRGSVDLLIVMSHMGSGGAQRVVANMLPLWIERGLTVAMILGNSSPRMEWAYDVPEEVQIVHHQRWVPRRSMFKTAGLMNVVRSFSLLRRDIKRIQPTTVLSLICPANIKTILACIGLRVPRVVVSERNNPSRQIFPFHVRLGRRLLYRYADVVTANSRGACTWLEQVAPRSAIEYLPNPVLLPSEVTRPISVGAQIRLIYVGRLVRQKRVRELIHVLAEDALSDQDLFLTMVGSGPERDRLEQLACELGVEEKVEFAGQVADVRSYYQEADAFLLLSRYEGMPNALLEAMGWKVAPIISREVNESICLIEHGRNGLVVDGENRAEVAKAIKELVGDVVLRARLAHCARATALEYSADSVVSEWWRILDLRKPECSATLSARISDVP